MNKKHHFEHHLLIAMPSLQDSNFSRAVIYLFEHTEQGALGMIVNKPLQIKLTDVMDHLGIKKVDKSVADLPVFTGGPVGQEHGFIIHEAGDKIDVTASKEILEDIAKKKGPKQFIVTLGYSGWGAGQLEAEISRSDWLIVPANKKIVFDTPISERWHKAAELIGVDLEKLSGQTGHA